MCFNVSMNEDLELEIMAKANSDCKKIVSYLKIVSNHVSVSKDRIGVSQVSSTARG